ncbi:MAG: hypothetical protein ACRC11_01055 [Xenococcaceae cyanobacterium]
MPATNVNIFGTGAITTTGTDPALTIKYSGQNAAGWNALIAGDEANPYKWLASIIANAKAYYDSLTSTEKTNQNLNIQANSVSLENRNGQVYRRYSYTINIYELDTGSSSFDPDKVV